MLSPSGEGGIIPASRVADAQKKGFSVGVLMTAKNGDRGVVPRDRVADAMTKGLTPWSPGSAAAASVPRPVPAELNGADTPQDVSREQYDAMTPEARSAWDAKIRSRRLAGLAEGAVGAVKGAGSTAYNVASFLDKVNPFRVASGNPRMFNDQKPSILEPSNPNEGYGYTAESIAEFLAPSGAITKAGRAVGGLAKGSKYLRLAGRAATEAAAYGGIEAAHGGSASDVAQTAGIGALGPLAEAGIGAGTKYLASKLPSTSPIDAIVSALAPTKKAATALPGHVEKAVPLLLDVERSTGTTIDSVASLAENTAAARKQVWSKYEQLNKGASDAGALVNGSKVADAGMQAALSAEKTQPMSKSVWKSIEEDIDFYAKPSSPVDAEEKIQTLNAQLRTHYAKTGVGQAAATKASPEMAVKSALADSLRAELDAAMENTTGSGARELKQQYASLRQLENAATDRVARIGVSDARQQFSGKNLASLYAKPALFAAPGLLDAGYGVASGDTKQVARGLGEAAIGVYMGKTGTADALVKAAFDGLRGNKTLFPAVLNSAKNTAVPVLRGLAASRGITLDRGRLKLKGSKKNENE
jgi:hypothetical protein